MIEQRLDCFNESNGVRQLGVPFKRCHVSPAGVYIELIRVTYRLERTIAKTAALFARRPLNFKHRLVHFVLLSRARVKSSKTNISMTISQQSISRGLGIMVLAPMSGTTA